MSRLIESIKLQDGMFFNLHYHEHRMMHSLHSLFGEVEVVDLGTLLHCSNFPPQGLYKCRIIYDSVSHEITYTPYEARRIQRIKALEDDNIVYPFKFEDRGHINRLFEMRGDCDDVLIIRNGMVTDCSYSNIVFRKGSEWFTPSVPLLEGTMRQNLLDQNKIQAREIEKNDIRSFDGFKIINAMLEFDSPEIDVSHIVF